MSKSDVAVEQDKLDVVALRHGTDEYGWGSSETPGPDAETMEHERDELLSDLRGELEQELRDRYRGATMMAMLDELMRGFRETGDVGEVGKRVVAMAKYVGHRSVEDFSLSDIGAAFGQTKAAVSARIIRDCSEVVESAGGSGKAMWQQGKEQRAVSAEAQRKKANS